MSAPKVDPGRAVLVVIDVQDGFRKVIPGFPRIAAATATMVRGADAIGLPIIVTEQYPKGLGATAEEISLLPSRRRGTAAQDRLLGSRS